MSVHGDAIRERLHAPSGLFGSIRRGSFPAQLHHQHSGSIHYIGPEKVFGLNRPGTQGESPGLPIIRRVSDATACFPPKHRKELSVSALPDSLQEAILAFILACSARRARGEHEADNSMLVHVTRFTLVQDQVAPVDRRGTSGHPTSA